MKHITTLATLILLSGCLYLLAGCTIFPEPVAQEMEEDTNPQSNHFL